MKNIENGLLGILKECEIFPENADNISIILGLICYKKLSERVRKDVNSSMYHKGITDFDYKSLSDAEAKKYKEDVLTRIGYFLFPSQLYDNLFNSENRDFFKEIAIIFRGIQNTGDESMSIGNSYSIFSMYSRPSNRLEYRNGQVKELSLKLNNLFQKNALEEWDDVDLFDCLISQNSSMQGKNGSEFYLPGNLAELMVRLVTVDNYEIKTVYNPLCGYGTLMSKFSKVLKDNFNNIFFRGANDNQCSSDLCWMNLIINGFHLNQFTLKESNPMEGGCLTDSDKFDIIITSYTKDLAIVDHISKHLEKDSVAALLTSPGVLFRSGRDKEIREKLIAKNLISAIIQLPSNSLCGNGIAPCIIVLSNKHQDKKGIYFINASRDPQKDFNTHTADAYYHYVANVYCNRKDIPHFSRYVSREEIVENEGSLNVSKYIQPYYLVENSGSQNSNSDWSRTYKFNNSTLTIKFGDVVASDAEVIVSSDDTEISMGGGVSQSILKAGGDFVREDAQKKLPALLGDVIVSTAGKLAKQKYIFHCLTIDYKHNIDFYKSKLSRRMTMNEYIVRHCVEECFRLIQALNLTSIAFPLIGTGIAGIDMNMVAKIMSEALTECLSHTNVSYQIELYLMDRFGKKEKMDYQRVIEFFSFQEMLIERNNMNKYEEEDDLSSDPSLLHMHDEYPVFISFSDKDWDMVNKLILQVLKKAGIEYFAYKKENYVGSYYQDKITHAINHAKVVIFACTKKSLNSREVRKELDYSQSRNKLIIPVRLDDSSTDWFDYNFMRIDYIDPIRMPNATQKLIEKVEFEIRRTSVLRE